MESDTLLFRSSICCWEWKTIIIPENCDNLEVILMVHTIYDFISGKKEDRLRLKRFKDLPKIHETAYEKGIFISDKACFIEVFILFYN